MGREISHGARRGELSIEKHLKCSEFSLSLVSLYTTFICNCSWTGPSPFREMIRLPSAERGPALRGDGF